MTGQEDIPAFWKAPLSNQPPAIKEVFITNLLLSNHTQRGLFQPLTAGPSPFSCLFSLPTSLRSFPAPGRRVFLLSQGFPLHWTIPLLLHNFCCFVLAILPFNLPWSVCSQFCSVLRSSRLSLIFLFLSLTLIPSHPICSCHNSSCIWKKWVPKKGGWLPLYR